MRHADHQLLHAELAAALDDLLEGGDQGLAAVEPETLGAGVALVAEALEHLGIGQALQDRALARDGEFGVIARHLDARLDPLALLELLDVHVFDADLLAIGRLERGQNLFQGRGREAEEPIDEDRPVEIGLGEAVSRRVEIGVIVPIGEAERIEIGDHVTAGAIGADEVHRAHGIERGLMHLLGKRRGRVAVRRRRRRGMAIGDQGLGGPAPAGALELIFDVSGLVFERGKEPPPALIDACRVLDKTGVKLGDVLGIEAGQKGGLVGLGHGGCDFALRDRLKIGTFTPNT